MQVFISLELELFHMVYLYLKFRGTDCFSRLLHHFTFSPSVCEGSTFSTSLPTLVIFDVSAYGHPNGCEGVSHCGFDTHYPNH